MARALSQDLRDRVVAAVEGGMSCRAVAARFGIGVATAVRWRQMQEPDDPLIDPLAVM